MKEIWKPVSGYEGYYEVSNFGRVRSLDRIDNRGRNKKGVIRKPKQNNRGYWQISLSRDGAEKYFLLHRLVAQEFVANPKKYQQVNHRDENKDNNNQNNLEWCTNLYNRRYGTGYQRSVEKHDYQKIRLINCKPVKQITLDGNYIKTWQSAIDAQRGTGINESNIRRCLYKKGRTAGGFMWERADKEIA